MAYLQSGTPWDSGSSATISLTVPDGVTTDQTVLIQGIGSAPAPATVSAVSGGITFTTLLPVTAYTNGFAFLIKGTGLSAGATISLTFDKSSLVLVSHHYFDNDFGALGTVGTVSSGSAAVTAPSITTNAGQSVLVIACDRNSTAAGGPSSVNSAGYTVTQLAYEASTFSGTYGQNYIAELSAAGTASGDTTVTFGDTTAKTNLMAVMIPELGTAPTGEVGFITAGQAIKDGSSQSSYTLTVPDGITNADSCLFSLSGFSNTAIQMSAAATAGTLTPVVTPRTTGTNSLGVWIGTGMQAGDQVTLSSSSGSMYTAEHWYFKGALTLGDIWQSPTAGTSDQAPSVTVGTGNNLYAFNSFRSTTDVSPYTVTNANGYDTSQLYTSYDTLSYGNTGLFQIAASAGASGITTIDMANAPVRQNGFAFHIVESNPVPPAPQVTVAWLNSLATTSVRAGWIVRNISSVRMVVSEQSDLSSPLYSTPVTVSADGWVTTIVTGLTRNTQYYVGLEADGVVLSDGRIQGKTLDDSGPESYVVLSGSCQYTGSNPAVFNQMATENALFFSHQGDLHYGDTTDAATWRNDFVSSMTAPNFVNFYSKLPMQYCYDNHDWAGQGSDGVSWASDVNPATMVRELTGEYPGTTELYRTWVHGRVRYIRLDQWSTRSDQNDPDTDAKRFMSDEQEQWFYTTLESAKEPLIVLFSNWPMYHNVGGGRWGSYPNQTSRLKAWIAAHPSVLNRMICIGGDSHSVCADTGANQNALGYIPTLNASPFAQAGGLAGGSWDIANLDVDNARGYYSRLTITDDGHNLKFVWDAVQDDGTIMATYTRTVGTPTVWDGVSELPTTVSIWDGTREATGSMDI